MIARVFGFFALLSAATVATADSLDFSLNDEVFRLTYAHELESETKGLTVDGGWLYTDKRNDSESLFHLGMMVSGQNWSDTGTFDISVGGRLAYSSPDKYDLLSAALGGDVRFSPIERLGIGGRVFYAPGILSFMDADSYVEYGMWVDYQLLPQAYVYLGYRKVEFDIEDARDAEYDDDAHIGLKMLF